MKTHTHKNCLVIALFIAILFLCPKSASAQSKTITDLEKNVYELNNELKYEQSLVIINRFLNQPTINDEDRYYGNLFLSYTHKRLFDYSTTLKYLNKALEYGIKTDKKDYFINNINCQKSLVYFDIHNYKEASLLMTDLAKSNYKYLNDEYQSKIIMQEAYLLYLDKKYDEAEKKYDVAIVKMKKSSPCDLPMIYGKKIELYGATSNNEKMMDSYNKSIRIADSCKILKYNLYSNQMLSLAYKKANDFKKAYIYDKICDSLDLIYNQQEHLKKLTELEKKYQTERNLRKIIIQEEVINSKNRFIAILFASLIGIILSLIIYFLRKHQLKLKKDKEKSLYFTKKLIEKNEEDKTIINNNILDNINHELLALKKTDFDLSKEDVNSKIDEIIEDIRIASRTLQPIMFEKIGLKTSIEQMIDVLQNKHNFLISSEIEYNGSLKPATELQLYRIIEEALTNIIKHSDAIAAKVVIHQDNNKISVEIKDNGKGFDVKEALNDEKYFGISNIIEKSKVIGGKSKISSSKNGTIITIEI